MKPLSASWIACLAAGIVMSAALDTQAQTQQFPFQNTSLPIEQRVADLVGHMTLDEKIAQTMNAAPAIPRLHVPAYDYWSEGLHGIARSGYATMFPQAIGMAATWDKSLVGRMGETVGTEARAKYNQAIRDDIHARYYGLTIWSPNINIFRDPRWGRGQETYGEDPYLTSRMGVAFVEGLQGSDPKHPLVVATPKHFAVHSGPESERHRFNVSPSPYDLEDTYLPAFRATITEAHADSLMCAYNAIDGVPACANTHLLVDKLRRDWGFTGFVTSDCGAIDDFFEPTAHHTSLDAAHASATAVLAGTDTNCGDTYAALGDAVKQKLVPISAIDTAVTRLFTARFKLGLFDSPQDGVGVGGFGNIAFKENNSAPHRELATQAARESMVLLKNENQALPLNATALKTIAVIGPNAASLTALEGNYNAIPSDPVLPVDGIANEFHSAKVLYAQGSPYAEQVMLPVPRTVFHPSATSNENGLHAEYFVSTDFSGTPAVTRIDKQIDFDWDSAAPVPGLTVNQFSVRWTGTITVPAPGDMRFSFAMGDCYPCHDHEVFTVFLDGKQVSTNDSNEPGDGRENDLPAFTLRFPDTRPHALCIEYVHKQGLFGAGITLNWLPPVEALRAEAVAAASHADAVIAFVGLSSKLEGEEMPVHVEGFAGGDRTDIQLPSAQRELLQAVAQTGKPLIVVLMNGSALAIPWAQEHANAILEAWYPGEAGGKVIAETLAGSNNPSGKLPLTFYASIGQLPPFTDYSMKGRTYRYFSGKPLYPFGYGLSYTDFTYSNIHLSTQTVTAGQPLVVDAEVQNTGRVAGDAVAELYLTPPPSDLAPRLALKGFERVHLAPGDKTTVHFTLSPRDLSQVAADGQRHVQAGSYSVYVGNSQPDPANIGTPFTITGEQDLPE
jgi:beta-glucosidase